jgi:hypothetical protein
VRYAGPTIVSTTTSKSLGASPSAGAAVSSGNEAAPAAPPNDPKPRSPLELWRSRAPLIAAFLGIGVVGVIVGRVSSSVGESSASPAPRVIASSVLGREVPPQQFDLTENPASHGGVPLRPMDRDIFAQIMSEKLERKQMHDVFPDRPYRVVFIGSASEHRIGFVLVDLDRDGKFEERWELKTGEVSRVVQADPAAQGQPVKYTLGHGRWQVH